MRYAHTNLICYNWKAQATFYTIVFQCQLLPPIRDQEGGWLDKGLGLANAHLKGAHLLLPGHGENGPTLELYSYGEMVEQNLVAPNQRGFGHLAFEVDDVESTLNLLLEHGGSKNGEISERMVEGVGIITFIYTRDPEGNLIELQNWKVK